MGPITGAVCECAEAYPTLVVVYSSKARDREKGGATSPITQFITAFAICALKYQPIKTFIGLIKLL